MVFDIQFQPVFDPVYLWGLTGICLAALILLLVKKRSIILTAIAFTIAIVALWNPQRYVYQSETAAPSALVLVDESASNLYKPRAVQTQKWLESLNAIPNLNITNVAFGTLDSTALSDGLKTGLKQTDIKKLSHIFIISDGAWQGDTLALNALFPDNIPKTLLLSDTPNNGDKAVQIISHPAYAITGRNVNITIKAHDTAQPDDAPIQINASRGKQSQSLTVKNNQESTITLPDIAQGNNDIVLTIPPAPNERIRANNQALIRINGLRDKISVLAVSLRVHPGSRVIRDFLNQDPAVDLIQFNILRHFDSIDNTPQSQLSLIPFPAHELFNDRIDEFDLIILDTWQPHSNLPNIYLNNVVNYVSNGGSLMVLHDETGDWKMQSPLSVSLPNTYTSLVQPLKSFTKVRQHPIIENINLQNIHISLPSVELIPSSNSNFLIKDFLSIQEQGEGRVAQFSTSAFWQLDRSVLKNNYQQLMQNTLLWLIKDPIMESSIIQSTLHDDQISIQNNSDEIQKIGILHNIDQRQFISLKPAQTHVHKIEYPDLVSISHTEQIKWHSYLQPSGTETAHTIATNKYAQNITNLDIIKPAEIDTFAPNLRPTTTKTLQQKQNLIPNWLYMLCMIFALLLLWICNIRGGQYRS